MATAGFFFVVGSFLLDCTPNLKHFAETLQDDVPAEKTKKFWCELAADIIRDLGIAFLVGAIIVFTF
jgi:hypothetical protein